MHAQVAGMAPQAVLDRMQSMAPLQPPPNLASHALGGQAGGTYLAPSLYRPVVQARLNKLAYYRPGNMGKQLAVVQDGTSMIRACASWALKRECHSRQQMVSKES